MRLVLASSSPRRAALLAAAGFEFHVEAAGVDERAWPEETPEAHVMRLSRAKADAVWSHARDAADVVLAADTVVVADGEILGKPRGAQEAAAMLTRLSGRSHDVLTGVAVVSRTAREAALDRTRVWFAALTPDEIAWYVATGEPHDKAGAYAVQGLGSRFVTRLDGSYSNVVGLPVSVAVRLLRAAGYAGNLFPIPSR